MAMFPEFSLCAVPQIVFPWQILVQALCVVQQLPYLLSLQCYGQTFRVVCCKTAEAELFGCYFLLEDELIGVQCLEVVQLSSNAVLRAGAALCCWGLFLPCSVQESVVIPACLLCPACSPCSGPC